MSSRACAPGVNLREALVFVWLFAKRTNILCLAINRNALSIFTCIAMTIFNSEVY